ncbi:MAG: hypothetical protein ACE5HJ_09860 [Thermoplasmata archaeon]
MRSVTAILLISIILLLSLSVLPGPASISSPAQATHLGDVRCPANPEPVHDGVLEPGEYSESFFDSKTKILLYFSCPEEANRTMHVAMVSPWEGWTEIRLQATEVWNGDLNVIRTFVSGSSVEVVDGFVNGTGAGFVDDLSLGGTLDVIQPVGTHASPYHIYELAIPLFSADVYDSQLTSNGSFYFQLAYAALDGPESDGEPLMESDPHLVWIGAPPTSAELSVMDLSLSPNNAPLEPVEVLVGLRDGNGSPLAFKQVSVFVQTAFGFLDLGSLSTNEQGVARVQYAPRTEGEYLIGAAFAGGDGYLASVIWLRLVVIPSDRETTFLPRGILVIQAVIVLVVGGIWSAYAYSVYIVRQALRSSRRDRWTDLRGRER